MKGETRGCNALAARSQRWSNRARSGLSEERACSKFTTSCTFEASALWLRLGWRRRRLLLLLLGPIDSAARGRAEQPRIHPDSHPPALAAPSLLLSAHQFTTFTQELVGKMALILLI